MLSIEHSCWMEDIKFYCSLQRNILVFRNNTLQINISLPKIFSFIIRFQSTSVTSDAILSDKSNNNY